MDICWLILLIYFCGGRGQPDGADNNQMRLERRCWPGCVTDLSVCLSVCLLSLSHSKATCSLVFLWASMLGVFAAVVWWWMGGCVGWWIPCCSLTEQAYALIGSLWLQHSHTRCTALHSWVNLVHEFNYCVVREIFLSEHSAAIYTGTIQWPAGDFITLLI